MPYDLLVRNGTVVDGSGAPARRADVAVQDGKIVAVGKPTGRSSRVIDAEGLAVAPGFVDMHTHYDCQLLWDPLATSSCWHGITTVLTGNCGFTIAPGRPSDADYLMRLMARVEGISLEVLQRGMDWTWDTFAGYLGKLEGNIGVNLAPLVGHSAVRYYVMGAASYERAATPDEVQKMKQAVREAMSAGAIGFSTSQTMNHVGGYGEPAPSRLSTSEELIELCAVLREFGKGLFAVNPNPGGGIISPAFQEVMVQAAKISGRPVLWNSLMERVDRADEWRQSIEFMDRARAQGAPIYAVARYQRMDLEFNLRSTYMFDGSQTWKQVLGKPFEQRKRLLADPETRNGLRVKWKGVVPPFREALLHVGGTKLPKNKGLDGKPVRELAAQAGKHPMDYVLDLSLEEDLDTAFIFIGVFNGNPEAVAEIIQTPASVPGVSDAGAHLDMDCGVDFTAVMLGHLVRERGLLTLEEAVRRLTSMSAGMLGITDRGLIREGMGADIVVFDPANIRALPREMLSDLPGGGRRIIQRAEGVKTVIVNGQVLIEDGRASGNVPGQVLRPQTSLNL